MSPGPDGRRGSGPGSGQRLGFFELGGRRVAFATLGRGRPLLCDLGRIHHLDVFLRYPPYRRLVAALAEELTVVRFDRPGCGLSDRDAADFTLAGELSLFDGLLAALGLEELDVLAARSSVPAMIAVAARRPARVRRLALFGAGLGPRQEAWRLREALQALLRAESALAMDVLTRRTAPGCDDGAVRWLADAYRQAASGAVVAQWLGESAALDVREAAGHVRCPTLLLNRREDQLVDLEDARDLAARLRHAVLVSVDGAESVMWEGDVDSLLRPLLGFLDPGDDPGSPEASAPLTGREREIAQLVAEGLTNAEIGDRLGIGGRTVESHLERLRSKLGLTSRADVAAWIVRSTADRD